MTLSDEQVQQISGALGMLLAQTVERKFAFAVESYEALMKADPTVSMLQLGMFKHPKTNDTLVVVWLGPQTRTEMEKWVNELVVDEVEIEVPIADANDRIN